MTTAELAAPWMALHQALGIAAPVRDEAHYRQLLETADELVDRIGGDESSALAGLLDLIGQRLRAYEAKAHPWPQAAAREVLRFLMEQHDLRQSDLPEVGPQSVVSDVLAGRRELNLRQVKALAARFSVPMETLT